VALAAFLPTAAAPQAAADAYPRQPLDVLHYDVSLSFVPSFSYEGRARLDVRLLGRLVEFERGGERGGPVLGPLGIREPALDRCAVAHLVRDSRPNAGQKHDDPKQLPR